MKPLLLAVCLAVLGSACQDTAAPTITPSASAPPVGPVVPATPRAWSVYTSQIKTFSLQLPSDWEVQPGTPTEDILLQITGGADGRLLLLEDFPKGAETFQSYARRYFEGILASDPEALEFVRYGGGRAARSEVLVGDSLTVHYLFTPSGGSAKVLSFGWDRPTPNPVWEMVAQRFNPHSPELIIPFATPAPAG